MALGITVVEDCSFLCVLKYIPLNAAFEKFIQGLIIPISLLKIKADACPALSLPPT